MGVWDYSLKTLVAYCPEAFVVLMQQQARIQAQRQVVSVFTRELDLQTFGDRGFAFTGEVVASLQENNLECDIVLGRMTVTGLLSTEFQGYDLDADGLLEVVTEDGETILLHFEFQSVNDLTIPERLLEYSFRAKKVHKKLVYSCVIFLRQDGIVPEPPLRWTLRNGKDILIFECVCIKLWEWTPEELLALNQPALLPLLVLTKGGANRTIVRKIYEGLLANKLYDLLAVANSLASQVLDEKDRQWSGKVFARMKRNILKDTPGYQFMTKEAREEGIELGIEQGRMLGRKEGLQAAALGTIATRFPALNRLAEKQVALIQHLAPVEKLFKQLITAQTAGEVKQYLVDAVDESLQLDEQ